MPIRPFVGGLLCLISLVACEFSERQPEPTSFAEGQVVKSDRDARLPRELANKIQGIYLAEYRRFRSDSSLTDRERLDQMKRKLLDISLKLKHPTQTVLEQAVQFSLPTGGGTVDLAEYVKPVRGSFVMGIEFPSLDASVANRLRVFYVSNARHRTILKESYGAGCDQFFEVTKYFKQAMVNGGIKLYSADQRFISVTAGTYYFAAAAEDVLYLASLTITDSRYSYLLCQP